MNLTSRTVRRNRAIVFVGATCAILLLVATYAAAQSADHGISGESPPANEDHLVKVSDEPFRTHEGLVSAADELCRGVDAQLDAAIARVGHAGTPEQRYLAQLDVLDSHVARLASLKAPGESAVAWEEFVTTAGAYYGSLRAAALAAQAEGKPIQSATRSDELEAKRVSIVTRARQLGLQKCWAPYE